jgi:1-acyl-sn-glycerol-3-phosphate acyltransferase
MSPMISPPPLEALPRFERLAVRLARRMNRGRWQRIWFGCQRTLGAGWIGFLTEPLLEVHGLEYLTATSRERQLLLAANHRTFFDLYVVMAALFRRVPGWRAINFPVRGRFFYQGIGGVLVNALAAFWAMYPPLFRRPETRRFDQWALGELAELCRSRPGQLIGYHPEGTRNRDPDPWSYLRVRSGIGRLLLAARPDVVPVFVAGLDGGFTGVVRRRLRGGEPIRIWFGAPLDYQVFIDQASADATPRRLSEFVMAAIRELGACDRARMTSGPARAGLSGDRTAGSPPPTHP